MREESLEQTRPLRSGYTTGACATATSLGAATYLLKGVKTETVTITLPKGKEVEFHLTECEKLTANKARAGTIKDGGDDPDATHGATVYCEVVLTASRVTVPTPFAA